ncbi:protein cortex isoform X2 [Cryptotermes secundus]|uniref:protein cortex isoform X2 n=1 Tax=Cryptotermes secundus TaxID=105785 RepID=UPI000CD7AB6E|nr:protein cortex isoform X2 [Cryptotermes secundus]
MGDIWRILNMLMQSFAFNQERRALHCHTGDRFIPRRCRLNTDNFLYTQALSEALQEEDILKQDICNIYVEEYGRLLQSALNLSHAHARLLTFCCSSPPEEKAPKEVYQWPIRCRRRPLIKQPHHLLDLPNFRSNFFLNLLDWGPSNYLAASLHNSVYLYATGEDTTELTTIANGYYSAVKWDSIGEKLVIGTNNSAIQVWNTRNRNLLAETTCNCADSLVSKCLINALAWHPSDTKFVSACSNGTLLLIPLSSFQLRSEQTSILRAHEGQICSLRCSQDGRFLASSGEDSAVRLWLWPSLTPGMEIINFGDPVRAMAWHPWKPSYLVIGSSISGSISLWNVNKYTQEAHHTLGSSAFVCSLEWSPVTGELVAGIWISEPAEDEQEPLGRSVLVVLKTLNKVVDRMECYAGQIFYLLWSPDGRQIATAGSDEALRIWYFLGPSSTREKDIRRFLKPLMPASFRMLPCIKKRNQNRSSYTQKVNKSNLSSFMEEMHYSINYNSFGCIIR